MAQISKARVTDIAIGSITIQGLMLPDGEYAISLQQLRMIAFSSTSPNNAKRELKAACGNDFQLLRVKTEISNNPQWIIKLDQLNYCLTELAFKGHEDARKLVRILSGLSLHQLFCDAFGVKFEKEERQQYLIERMAHKKQYHPLLTKWLKQDGCVEGWQYGQAVNEFKQVCGLPIKPVETYNSQELYLLNTNETQYNTLRTIGWTHGDTLAQLAKNVINNHQLASTINY